MYTLVTVLEIPTVCNTECIELSVPSRMVLQVLIVTLGLGNIPGTPVATHDIPLFNTTLKLLGQFESSVPYGLHGKTDTYTCTFFCLLFLAVIVDEGSWCESGRL